MPLVRKSDSSGTVTKRKTSPKVLVSTTRQPSTIREMGDTAFGTLDSSDDGSIVSYDSNNDKFILVTPDSMLLTSVDDNDLPDAFIEQIGDEITVASGNLDAGAF